MGAALIIVFREVLEAALVISIVAAATKGLIGRTRWINTGVIAGIIGALIVAAFAGQIANAAHGFGQDYFNAGVLLAAVSMLAWHNVWMAKHGRELAQNLTNTSRAVVDGSKPLYAIAIIVGAAILREGSEIVLFMHGIAASTGTDGMLLGGILGLVVGGLLGFGLYAGLVRIPMKYMFTVTSWLILLLAAGMASQASRYLVQAGVLPDLGGPVWDTSWLLPESSMIGEILHVLIGYADRPRVTELLFYIAAIVIIGGLMLTIGKAENSSKKTA